MKAVVLNETIIGGKIAFDVELLPANEHEHGLIAEVVTKHPYALSSRIEKPGDLLMVHVEMVPLATAMEQLRAPEPADKELDEDIT